VDTTCIRATCIRCKRGISSFENSYSDCSRRVKLCVCVTEFTLHEVCQWENFDSACPRNSVLVVDQATYGRRVSRPGRCIDRTYDRTDCVADVKALAGRRCSGRRSCSIGVPGPDLDGSPHGCPRDLKANLEISYHCIAGNFTVQSVVNSAC